MPVKLFTAEVGNVAKWRYPNRVKTKKGSWAVYVVDEGGNQIRVQLNKQNGPKCGIPFGISSWDDDPTKMRKNMEISLRTNELTDFFAEIDENNIQQGVAHSKEWFKSELTREEVETKYKRLVQQPDGKWDPNVRTKVNINTGRFPLRVLNYVSANSSPDKRDHWKPGNSTDISKGSEAIVIIKISALWFMNSQFGMTVESTDVLLYPNDTREDFDFVWNDEAPSKAVEAVGTTVNPPQTSVLFIDSDEPGPKRQRVNDKKQKS